MSSEMLRRLLTYIDDHICEKISLVEVAKLAGYSPFYFSKLFAEIMGMPITGYIRIRKLQYALVSLLEGRKVLEVSLMYSFDSHEGFTRSFKQLFGTTPSKVRRYLGSYQVPELYVPSIGERSVQMELVKNYLTGNITSDAYFQNNIDAYSKLRKIADKYGIKVLIENVVCNQEDPMKHWCELKTQFSDISFVFDTKMASFHSQMELLYEEEYQWLWRNNHICHYHVNDYAGGYKEWGKLRTLPIGQGHVEFDRFFEFINMIGYRGTFTVEATAFDGNGVIDIDMLNKQFEDIRNAMCN